MKKFLRFLFILLILGAGLGFGAIHLYATELISQPDRRIAEATPKDVNLDYDNLTIIGEGGIEMQGFWTLTKQEPKGVIILVHGIGANRAQMIEKANLLAQQGFDAVMMDGRAHGESEGDYVTYGFFEKKDVQKIVDFIKEENEDIPVGIWGASLGGAIALQAMAEDNRIEFGVAESTFRSMDEIVFDYGKRMARGVMLKPVTDYALRRAGEEGGFDPQVVRPIESVTQINQPVMIAHGDADQRISVSYGQDLYDNLKTEDKELVIVPGAGHLDMMEVGGEGFISLVMDFLNAQVEIE